MIKSCLIVEKGATEKRVLPLYTKITVGRGASNDIALRDPAVSKRHAIIGRVRGQAVVKDLGSRNGTFVNEEKITKSILYSGDTLRMGNVTLRFFQEEATGGEKAAPGAQNGRWRKRLGEYLLEAGIIDEQTLHRALDEQEENKRIGQVLVDMGVVDEADVAKALAKQLRIPFLSLKERVIPQEVVDLVPAEVAETNFLVPVEVQEGRLLVAMADPLNDYALQVLRFLTGLSIDVAVGPRGAILEALERHYPLEHLDKMLALETNGDDVEIVEYP
jgi:hypothetical protein